jgi:hypothetical protein
MLPAQKFRWTINLSRQLSRIQISSLNSRRLMALKKQGDSSKLIYMLTYAVNSCSGMVECTYSVLFLTDSLGEKSTSKK